LFVVGDIHSYVKLKLVLIIKHQYNKKKRDDDDAKKKRRRMILRVAAFFFILDPRTGLFYLLFIYCYSSYASACPGYYTVLLVQVTPVQPILFFG
jgi:hypothetical protein